MALKTENARFLAPLTYVVFYQIKISFQGFVKMQKINWISLDSLWHSTTVTMLVFSDKIKSTLVAQTSLIVDSKDSSYEVIEVRWQWGQLLLGCYWQSIQLEDLIVAIKFDFFLKPTNQFAYLPRWLRPLKNVMTTLSSGKEIMGDLQSLYDKGVTIRANIM